ncbi:MAG: cbb3-type cytochrome oxidase assembly protein CcoS [Turneriella sp.]|nr:cbb3-type cytochrome oxidase assembly protein CcoS [Turneriella sp.]
MEALFILLIFSVLLGAGFLIAFFWALRSGQFEDTETPALRILFDDLDSSQNTKQKITEEKSHGN